jgi:hypothetical protein
MARVPTAALRRLAAPALLLAIIAGCKNDFDIEEPGVALAVNSASYAVGSPITLIVANPTFVILKQNLCTRELQRRTDEETWVLQIEGVSENGECTRAVTSLLPGDRDSVQVTVPAAWPDGEYRFRLNVRVEAENATYGLLTQPFTVNR